MRVLVCTLAVALLAACSREAPPAEPQETVPTPTLAELALDPITGDAPIAGRLSGELGCSFRVGEDQLLLAMGFVASQERAEALVVRGGEVVELQATEEAGFDGLGDGATFQGEGVSVEVALGASRATGSEEVSNDATLTLRADGQERAYEGVWTCGP
jgi:hypothetical protein